MAQNESNTTLKENNKTSTYPVRPVANFPPPIWDDRLLSLTVDYLVRVIPINYGLKPCMLSCKKGFLLYLFIKIDYVWFLFLGVGGIC